MARDIVISIDTSQYLAPSQEDVDRAKRFVLQRVDASIALVSAIDIVLDDMAERIAVICYKYGIEPERFTISSEYNEDMMYEIAEVMDDIEEQILSLIDEYSTRVTSDRTRIAALLAWLSLLGRDNRNLQDTLDIYLRKTMRDFEAALAALAYADCDMATAVGRLKQYKHQIWNMPEMRNAFRHKDDFESELIRTKGVTEDAVGLSSSGATNVTRMARTTLEMTWMRSLRMSYEEDGAAGYYVVRGSKYPCELCDSMCGFHPIKDTKGFPPYHPRCCCIALPVFFKD